MKKFLLIVAAMSLCVCAWGKSPKAHHRVAGAKKHLSEKVVKCEKEAGKCEKEAADFAKEGQKCADKGHKCEGEHKCAEKGHKCEGEGHKCGKHAQGEAHECQKAAEHCKSCVGKKDKCCGKNRDCKATDCKHECGLSCDKPAAKHCKKAPHKIVKKQSRRPSLAPKARKHRK